MVAFIFNHEKQVIVGIFHIICLRYDRRVIVDSCGLSTATIEYSCRSVCVSVCVSVRVCVCVYVCVKKLWFIPLES